MPGDVPLNPPAFPRPGWSPDHDVDYQEGMSLRDWFAGQVLAGLCAINEDLAMDASRADRAYAIADAMLAERALSTRIGEQS